MCMVLGLLLFSEGALEGVLVTSDRDASEGGRVRGLALTRVLVVGIGTGRTCLTCTDGRVGLQSEKSDDTTLVACVFTESSEEVELTSVSPSYPPYVLLSEV